MVSVLQNEALKWKKKLTGVRSPIVQRSYIKIEILRGKNPTEFHNALHEVCGDSVVDRSTVSRWASRFREGRVSHQGDTRSGRPVTAIDDTSVVIVSTLLEEDRRKSCDEIVHEAKMSTTSLFRIVTQTLQKRKVAAKWVRNQLSEEQKAVFYVYGSVHHNIFYEITNRCSYMQ